MIVRICCDGINCNNDFYTEAPEGWNSRLEPGPEFGGGSNYTFCPECKAQGDWFEAQCPGCVSGYPSCGLGNAFFDSRSRTITEEQLAQIERGTCPFRVNGSFFFSRDTGFGQLDMSEKAPTEAGLAVAKAIRAYCEKYPKQECGGR